MYRPWVQPPPQKKERKDIKMKRIMSKRNNISPAMV
jgi:hypothetical protein